MKEYSRADELFEQAADDARYAAWLYNRGFDPTSIELDLYPEDELEELEEDNEAQAVPS